MQDGTPLYELSALELSKGIHAQVFTCQEVMTSFLAHIQKLNPHFNAIVSLREPKDLMAEAKEADEALQKGHSKGWMHGLPIAIKDLAQTAGVATTMGSLLLKNNVPKEDCLMVSRMRQSGAILIGKTNTPEFGLGSHTSINSSGPHQTLTTPNAQRAGAVAVQRVLWPSECCPLRTARTSWARSETLRLGKTSLDFDLPRGESPIYRAPSFF